jgi:hypothetical protein
LLKGPWPRPTLRRRLRLHPTQYSVADFYGNTEYFGASFSPTADRILASSNRSGVYNAYASYFPADDRILCRGGGAGADTLDRVRTGRYVLTTHPSPGSRFVGRDLPSRAAL